LKDQHQEDAMAGNGGWAELSCQVKSDGTVSFTASSEADGRMTSVSATQDAHGNIKSGNWIVRDQQGTIVSVDLPDGVVRGRNAPTDPAAGEAQRENAGQLLTRTADACKKGLDLRLF
jgi:hypothetical protein